MRRFLQLDNYVKTRPGYVLAILLAAISIGGLALPSLYVRETASWRAQALAQDWFDLVVASPAIALTTYFASRGSRRACALLAGLDLYAVYTLAIYCFAVHFNALFLVYCATFGIALYSTSLLGPQVLREGSLVGQPRRAAGGFLIAVGLLFAALWLSQVAPAALRGTEPNELRETGLATNPIHVLDLAFILPLHVIAGLALVRHRSYAPALTGGLLGFGAAMASSIAFLALRTGGLPVAIAMTIIAATSAVLASLVTRRHATP